MAKEKDTFSKIWAVNTKGGFFMQRFFGAGIEDYLATEQPMSNLQADLVVRTVDGEIHHLEFQATNEKDFALRMLRYLVWFRTKYGRPIHQCVFYIGREPMRLDLAFAELGTRHEFRIVNLQDFDAEEILASPHWADLVWAIGAKGDPTQVLPRILQRFADLNKEDQQVALSQLGTYATIMKLDGLLNESLKEFPMITVNLEDSAIGRSLMEKGLEKGRQEGRQEGMAKGRLECAQDLLVDQLANKFGDLPAWVTDRVQKAPLDDLKRWAHRFVRANSLEETLD